MARLENDDEALFEELSNIVPANIHDHTDEGSTYDKSQLLNGATGGVVGSVLTIPVGVGDKINASVYAKYLAPTGTTNPTAAVGSLLAAALTGNTGTLNYEGSITSSYGTSGSMVTNMYGDDLSDTEPKAFINLMFLSDDITKTPVIAFNQIKSASSNAHAQLTLPEEFVAPSAGYIVVYLSNESDKLTEVYFDDLVVTVNEHPVIQKDNYMPFGLTFNSYQRVTAKKNDYLYNGKELIDDLDIDWYDYGARMYMPEIGRWGVVDPAADLLEMSSPFVYSLNNPINFIDPDGELPIFINGRVMSNSERADASYWDAQLLSTIKSSGIANPGGERHFVDGDRFTVGGRNQRDGMPGLLKGNFLDGNWPGKRHDAGYHQGKRDFESILSKLERDPESGKIVEKIQIYSHSRGAAFATGYTEALLKMISQNADQFANPNSVIDFVLHLAPHQSGGLQAFSENEFSIHHTNDVLSGNNMKNLQGAFESDEGSNVISAHSTTSFINDVSAFLSAYLSSDGNNEKAMNQFMKKMKEFGIEVTVK